MVAAINLVVLYPRDPQVYRVHSVISVNMSKAHAICSPTSDEHVLAAVYSTFKASYCVALWALHKGGVFDSNVHYSSGQERLEQQLRPQPLAQAARLVSEAAPPFH